MRVEFGVGLFVVFLTMMLFMVMLFAMVLFVVMFFMAMFFAMVFLVVMLVTMLFVRVREEAGLNFGLFEGASGGGGEDEQRGAVAQCLAASCTAFFCALVRGVCSKPTMSVPGVSSSISTSLPSTATFSWPTPC